MSWAEEMGYEGFDPDYYLEIQNRHWEQIFVDNLKKGYIWQDRYGNQYRKEDISNQYLVWILRFCVNNYRPAAQIKLLKAEAERRGINLIMIGAEDG